MKAELLAEYRTRIADRTLITLSVLSIERILDERLLLLAALDALLEAKNPSSLEMARSALEYAQEPVP